jgi:hypothetical protein
MTADRRLSTATAVVGRLPSSLPVAPFMKIVIIMKMNLIIQEFKCAAQSHGPHTISNEYNTGQNFFSLCLCVSVVIILRGEGINYDPPPC